MIEIQLSINIKRDKQILLSPTAVNLLRKIQSTGSLKSASREMFISYQNAWTLIDNVNKTAPNDVVLKQRGGSGGGGAVISEYGKLLLKEYSIIEQQVEMFINQLNTEVNL